MADERGNAAVVSDTCALRIIHEGIRKLRYYIGRFGPVLRKKFRVKLGQFGWQRSGTMVGVQCVNYLVAY